MRTRTLILMVVASISLGLGACSLMPKSRSEGAAESEPGIPTASEIRHFVEGSWQLETWHVGDEILRPPAGRGYILFHDGVVLFTVVRDHGERTLTRFGHGEYQVADGEWSYRYDDNHYIETEGPGTRRGVGQELLRLERATAVHGPDGKREAHSRERRRQADDDLRRQNADIHRGRPGGSHLEATLSATQDPIQGRALRVHAPRAAGESRRDRRPDPRTRLTQHLHPAHRYALRDARLRNSRRMARS